MYIAICDDDEGVCFQLEEWLQEYQKEKKIRWDIEVFYRAEQLFEEMEKGSYFDVVFLDIEFPGKTGVELAREMRIHLENQDTRIVFISGETKYCPELFELETLNFHQKPLLKEDIYKDLGKVLRYNKECMEAVTYTEDGLQRMVPLHKIMYFKSENKKVVGFISDGSRIVLRTSLRELAEKNEKFSFCQTHRSYVVNFSYVKKYLKKGLMLKNEEEIPISCDFDNKVKLAWANYGREW